MSLDVDADLLRAADEGVGGEALRFWESPSPMVVVGRSAVVTEQVHMEACQEDGVPVLRRDSGGGAVVLGPGCLNYSLVLSLDERPELRDVGRSYQIILKRIAASLGIPGLAVRGLSDLALGDRKVSGNAQRRGRRALLHHGTMLYNFDPACMERYLKEPVRQPPYRSRRRHTEFIANVPLSAKEIRGRIACDILTPQHN